MSLNGHLVREVTATELDDPFAKPDNGLGKALAQDAGNTHADDYTDGRDAESEPELLRNRGIQDGLWLLDHHAPLSHGQMEAGCWHTHSVFVDIVSLDELQVLCARVLHEVLDQRTVSKGQPFEDEIGVIAGNQLAKPIHNIGSAPVTQAKFSHDFPERLEVDDTIDHAGYGGSRALKRQCQCHPGL